MLHHVVEYAKKHVQDSEIGFSRREIMWLLRLDARGNLLGVEPLQDKRAKHKLKSRCPDMPSMRAGGDAKRAHFLVEVASAALLYGKEKETAFRVSDDDKTVRRHEFFKRLLDEAAKHIPLLHPVVIFLNDEARVSAACLTAGTHRVEPNEWVRFSVDDYDPLQDPAVLDWWRTWLRQDAAPKASASKKKGAEKGLLVDLLSGEQTTPIKHHPVVKGLNKGLGKGGGDAQAPLVSMDKAAFQSFGLKSGLNASMGAMTAQLYADGLSELIEKAHIVAGAKIAYWYRDELSDADLDPIFAVLNAVESHETKEAGALHAARKLLESVQAGQRSAAMSNHYFAMTISGLMGRVMVRDWMEGPFDQLLANTVRWFEDLEIIGLSGQRSAPDPKFETVVTCLLPEQPKRQKYSDWVKPIGSARRDLWHAALNSKLTISVAALGRLVSELPTFMVSEQVTQVLFPRRRNGDDQSSGLLVSRLYARMGLIKAYFIRKLERGDNHMKPHLYPDHPEPAYHCGRLLAVFAELQHDALGDVGAGVIQRFYPAASQTPGLTLGRLVSNARNHLGKLPLRDAQEYEEKIGVIMSKLGDHPPRTLDLEGQGLFALGYYQQLADLRGSASVKKSTPNANESGDKA